MVLIALKSSSIDLQLIRIPEKGQREVLFAERKVILLDNSQDPQLYTKQCVSELASILKQNVKEIQRLTQGKITSTTVLLYAPWYTSEISSIAHKEGVIISEKFLDAQLKGVATPEGLVNLEKKVIRILANGYSVTELSQSKFSNISMDVYASYISRQTYDTISDTIKLSLPRSGNITYATSSVLLFRQIKTHLVNEDNVTFVYVGGEITEVGIIEDDSLSSFATFPIGKHDFIREIQGSGRTLDYDLLYQKELKMKSDSQQQRFEALKAQWADTLIQTVLSYKRDIPSKFLIIADSKSRDFFANLLTATLESGRHELMGQHRIINFDMSHLKDIIIYKTPTLTDELDLQLEALT
jgi:hypothetical protein